ncbi:phospholipase D beta 2-like [Diospyros lotus]|uniref:phospholipase D beta 2-like n=1 Tax=Diospyros lotus TaxID=55363 RepID=UPI002256D9AE|nr:phospholipase D beta 2-like [Diospyros lotus]
MDNYNPSSSYPHDTVYGYPHGPSPYPIPNSGQYPPPAYPPPYYNYPYPSPPPGPPPPTSHSGDLEYWYHPPSHSGPVPYPYHAYPVPPPQPSLQHQGSFDGASPYHHHHQPSAPALLPAVDVVGVPPPRASLQHQTSVEYGSPHHRYHHEHSSADVPSRVNSFSDHPYQDSKSSVGIDHHRHGSMSSLGNGSTMSYDNANNSSAYPPFYPPIHDLLSNVHISDSATSGPASPPAPAAAASAASSTPPPLHSLSAKHNTQGSFYGYSNTSFSDWSGSHSGPIGPAALSHSNSFDDSPHSQSTQIVPFSTSKGSLKVLLLHGNLDIWVYEAKNLPNMDMFHKTLGDVFNILPGNMSNRIEGSVKHKITSDPYVSISVASAVIGRTYVVSNSENPVWKQRFYVPVAHHAAEVHFLVKDSDVVGSQLMGVVAIPVEQIYSGEMVQGVYPILNSNGKPCKSGAVLSLSIQYTPIERLSIYHHGVGAGPDYFGIRGTYFPLRRGGKVTLYQDAHVPEGYLPGLKLDHGMQYVHGKCWHDIFDAIRQARRLIYITGWSVWHQVRLVRDSGHASSKFTLGDLLKSKSQEGVRVLLLVWDDPTSRSILGYKTDGIMQTHDEETRRFFKHSSVQVLLCPRVAGKRHSWIKQREVGTIYTHHQKSVIVDADAGDNRRKIIAFIGGLDLCDGRYDTPEHPIFRTLQTIHADDYHNPTYVGSVAGCPREPWHDLHCKIDGPAAYDVLTNFEERWLKASKPHGIKKLRNSYDDALLRLERMPEIIGLSDAPWLDENDPESWHVQIFRSIDSNSVRGFPKDGKEAVSKNLMCGKNVVIDMSIHTAYVKAIRAAQHFIYIENQYFIGSSYNWSSYKDLGANNLIPMEIALKIAEKIRAHERFAAYIVIPMWPEGNPTGAATQRILFWQHKTMQMMYATIYKALVEVGLENAFTPQDYLNFFCLGNREVENSKSSNTEISSATNTPQALSQKSRRFMIYVHSKGMIVDDEYIIMGSANINQRSMEGTRDTEIAMGAYQPQHTWAKKLSNPRGQIYGYRMSLWAEHLGIVEDCFTKPESIECVRQFRSFGERNWEQFAADEVTEMKAHLLKYPVEVDRQGRVKSLPGCEDFPDVGGRIVGSFLAIQENLTI